MEFYRIARNAAAAGVLSALFCIPNLHAQFGSFVKSLASHEAEKAAQDKLDHHANTAKTQSQNVNSNNSESNNGDGHMLQLNGAYSFTQGPVTLFEQNFASTPTGRCHPISRPTARDRS